MGKKVFKRYLILTQKFTVFFKYTKDLLEKLRKQLSVFHILALSLHLKCFCMIHVDKIRKDFPILERTVHNKPLVYFDNAATSQTPQIVIDTIVDYYSNYNANIHRGVHTLSQEATDKYEEARIKIQQHFNAKKTYEIILTSGTTHGINMIASGFGSLLSNFKSNSYER